MRQIVNHIVGHEYRFADNIATNCTDYYVGSRDDDFLRDDPHGAWATGVAALDAAVAGLDGLDTVIEWRVPLPARDLLAFRIFEIVVHTWDLSCAIGFDEQFDERSAVLVIPIFEQLIEIPVVASFFAASTCNPPGDTSPQHRLLLMAGRKP